MDGMFVWISGTVEFTGEYVSMCECVRVCASVCVNAARAGFAFVQNA